MQSIFAHVESRFLLPFVLIFAAYIAVVAQHSIDIESKKFGMFFKKPGKYNDSSDDVKTAWSVILPHTEEEATKDIQTVSNAWFNSLTHVWSKAVDV